VTVSEVFSQLKNDLSSLESPRLEAERMMAYVLRLTTSQILLNGEQNVSADELVRLKLFVARRLRGEPLAYILGTQGFYKYDFVVRTGVLIPRPETELVVDEALKLFPKGARLLFGPHRVIEDLPQDVPRVSPFADGEADIIESAALRIADFGCGSGCIGLSLLKEWPDAKLTAIDASPIAIITTKENASLLDVDKSVEFVNNSIENWKPNVTYDLIVANPPYIDFADARLEKNVRLFEPNEALFASENGYRAIFSWAEIACKVLRPGGWLLLEIGTGQSPVVMAKLATLGFTNIEAKKDLSGHDRMIKAQT
jgi:release factor glutamine methyltransferase